MGSGLAKNLLLNGIDTFGYDLDTKRIASFVKNGGTEAKNIVAVGKNADAVFVMVMNGEQVNSVILGKDGLISIMPKGSTILLTATVKPSEAHEIANKVQESGVHFIDCPVSGGFAGAQNGTLTMMASGNDYIIRKNRDIMEAVSEKIHHVGIKPGQGQTIKACLQSLIGAQFSATFEAAVLAAKAGLKGEVLLNVFSSSGAGCGVVNNALEKIIDREFEGTGSHINTMHKDLTISLNLAETLGVPMHTAAAAMQIFHAGRAKYPNGDNWVCTRVIEEIVGAQLNR